jgi:hypothetical protein
VCDYNWSEERIVLIGDACHPMLPYMAQVAGSSMEDAVVLARCLDGRDLDGFADAFRKLERNRKERTSRIQLGARQNVWMRTSADTAWLYDYDAWTVPLSPSRYSQDPPFMGTCSDSQQNGGTMSGPVAADSSSPSACAVIRFTTRSNLVGCSTGATLPPAAEPANIVTAGPKALV